MSGFAHGDERLGIRVVRRDRQHASREVDNARPILGIDRTSGTLEETSIGARRRSLVIDHPRLAEAETRQGTGGGPTSFARINPSVRTVYMLDRLALTDVRSGDNLP